MAETPPHIRVLLDAIKDTHAVATATGMLQPLVLGGLTNLWHLCWREDEDLVDEMQLRGCFGPYPPELIPALIAFHFLEAHEAGQWRVRGAEELLRISRQKVEAGKARAAGAKRDAGGRMVSSDGPADHQRTTSEKPAGSQPTTQPPTHPSTLHPSTTTTDLPEEVVVGAWERFQEKREENDYGREAQRPAKFAAWLKVALAVCSLDDLLRAYEVFLGDDSIKNKTHATAVFMRDGVWSTRIPPAPPPPPPPPEGAPPADPAAEEIWAAVLQRLRNEGKAYALESLTKLIPCALSGSTLTLWGQDRFFLEWVKDHYGGLLAGLLDHQLFVTAPDTPRRPLNSKGEGEEDG